MRDFQNTQNYTCNENSRDHEPDTDKRPLTPAGAANDFCAATATDHRAVGHGRLAVRAQEHVFALDSDVGRAGEQILPRQTASAANELTANGNRGSVVKGRTVAESHRRCL